MFQRAIPVTRKHSFKRVKPKGLLCQDQLQFTFQKKKKKTPTKSEKGKNICMNLFKNVLILHLKWIFDTVGITEFLKWFMHTHIPMYM